MQNFSNTHTALFDSLQLRGKRFVPYNQFIRMCPLHIFLFIFSVFWWSSIQNCPNRTKSLVFKLKMELSGSLKFCVLELSVSALKWLKPNLSATVISQSKLNLRKGKHFFRVYLFTPSSRRHVNYLLVAWYLTIKWSWVFVQRIYQP